MPRRSLSSELLILAGPLVAASAGTQLLAVVNTILVGRLDAAALAGVGIGNGVFMSIGLIGMGIVLGADPVIAQAVGAGDEARARRAFWQALRLAVWIGIPLTALAGAAPFLIGRLGVDPTAVSAVADFLPARLPGLIPFLVFAACRSYLQARGVTWPIVAAMVAANLVNLVAAGLLIFGDRALVAVGLAGRGYSGLGVTGAGLATSAAIVASAILGGVGVAVAGGPRARTRDDQLAGLVLRLGLPVGLQLFAEVAAFAAVGVVAGIIGSRAAAGHQVAITVASFTFTFTIGLASATSVLVGRAVGAGDAALARRAGVTGLVLSGGFMAACAVALLLAPAAIARLFSDDPVVVRAAAPLVFIAGFFQIFDGLQSVAAGALRGAGDTRAAFVANLVGYYLVGLPLALALAFPGGLGARGLWWGLVAALVTVATSLVLRFRWLARRPMRRV